MNVLTYISDAQDDEIPETTEPETVLVWGTGNDAALLTWSSPEPEDD